MMRTIPFDEILRVWSQSSSAAAAARSLGLSRRTLYYRWHSASLKEVLQAIAQIVADDNARLQAEQQAIERLTRENQALREEIARLKSTRTERAQGPGNVPVIRRVKRLITLEED